MTCHDCHEPITSCVRLSEFVRVCEECYAANLAAYREEITQRPYQALPAYCPSPAELAERAAAVRRANGDKPRDVNPTFVGVLQGGPKVTTSNMQRRKGTEDRAV